MINKKMQSGPSGTSCGPAMMRADKAWQTGGKDDMFKTPSRGRKGLRNGRKT
jgi:hypothetical protein